MVKPEMTELAKALHALEQERNWIGVELHDNVSQVLAAARLYLEAAINCHPQPGDYVQKGHDYVLMAINEIRMRSHALVTPAWDQVSLIEAIGDLITDIHHTTNLQVELETGGFTGDDCSPGTLLMLYRVVQEQLNNILRHADAKNIQIIFHPTSNELQLSITDDGRGFDSTKQTSGIGLRNIRSRVMIYGGTMSIRSAPGKGCQLQLNIPLAH